MEHNLQLAKNASYLTSILFITY